MSRSRNTQPRRPRNHRSRLDTPTHNRPPALSHPPPPPAPPPAPHLAPPGSARPPHGYSASSRELPLYLVSTDPCRLLPLPPPAPPPPPAPQGYAVGSRELLLYAVPLFKDRLVFLPVVTWKDEEDTSSEWGRVCVCVLRGGCSEPIP